MAEAGEITMLLRDWRAGNPAAIDHLFELVYPQLRQIAGALFRGERPENLLQPTSVVNELFLKLIRQRSLRFEDREHFYSLSARLMRRVLVDQARSEGRQKRDGGFPVPLEADMAWINAKTGGNDRPRSCSRRVRSAWIRASAVWWSFASFLDLLPRRQPS